MSLASSTVVALRDVPEPHDDLRRGGAADESRSSAFYASVRRHVLSAYVVIVGVAGAFALVAVIAAGQPPGAVSVATWCFIAILIVGEMFPIRLLGRRGQDDLVTVTSGFAFAVLLTAGVLTAALALVAAALVSDLRRRSRPDRILFNAGQYALAITVAGVVLSALTGGEPLVGADIDARELFAIIVAGGAFFIVNHALTMVALALHSGISLLHSLRHDSAFQLATEALLIAWAPLAGVVGHANLVLLPLLALPLLTAYQSVKTSRQREHEALHDALTQLPNRAMFFDRARTALGRRRRAGDTLAVLLLDLDGFKEINDTLGHHTGDQLLVLVGPRLEDAAGPGATVARLGGDEFGILLPNSTDATEAMRVATDLRLALDEPFDLDGFRLNIKGSFGVAMFPEHGNDVETLVQRADVAMYEAKATKAGCLTYCPETDRHSRRRLELVGELTEAIHSGQLSLHYQPKVLLPSGDLVGAEALVRWNHPVYGLVFPDEFIPLAERTGLIKPLTTWVLGQAMTDAAIWHRRGWPLTVAVNVSVQSLYDTDFTQLVADGLAAAELDPSALELEVTETTIMSDPERAITVLQALSDLGVSLAVDDFGTGYSSLAYLRQLPVDAVKVDKSFVMGLVENPNDCLIVEATIDLARRLRLQTVAEGVETPQAWDLLARMGCDAAQGYLISRPVLAAEFATWVLQRAGVVRLTNVGANA